MLNQNRTLHILTNNIEHTLFFFINFCWTINYFDVTRFIGVEYKLAFRFTHKSFDVSNIHRITNLNIWYWIYYLCCLWNTFSNNWFKVKTLDWNIIACQFYFIPKFSKVFRIKPHFPLPLTHTKRNKTKLILSCGSSWYLEQLLII